MLTVLMMTAGLGLLAAGGELLVRGASRLAARFGVSSLVIGLTVVAFGTSAPELAVALQSVRAGAADLAVGNVIGSNIFNTLLILGVSALVAPLIVSRRVIRVEVPIVIGVSALAWVSASDGRIGTGDGVLLLLVLTGYLAWLLRNTAADSQPSPRAQTAGTGGAARETLMALAGFGVLVLGARWLVDGAVALATALGVSDVVIGLTVVAAGTSLPEVAASVVATLRGERDMAVGNVLGSNLFNLTAILGVTAVAAGGLPVADGVVSFDVIVMVAVAVACLPIMVTGHAIARWEGALFVAYYVAYTTYLVLDATAHDRLPHFRDALAYFALPLTGVTLLVLASRALLSGRQRRR